MIPCANCGVLTRLVVVVDDPDGVIWRCKACESAGRPSALCSPGCFYEHAALHDSVLSHWESLPELEGGGRC